jgi:hypothetical protein
MAAGRFCLSILIGVFAWVIITGRRAGRTRGSVRDGAGAVRRYLDILCQAKTSSLRELMQRPGKQTPSRCLVM